MNATNFGALEMRLRRLERLNTILISLLCAMVGLVLLGATKGVSANVMTVEELRTQRLSLVDNTGRVVHSWTVHGSWVIEK